MTLNIPRLRLHNQLVSQTDFTEPGQVVEALGAVQAQDYAGAKWALGLRLTNTTDSAIEKAFEDGKILRTHVMRPTWHFVTPADIRWMLELTAPRVRALLAYNDRQLGLDQAMFKKSHAVLKKALQNNQHLTRSEMGPIFEKAGIAVEGLRLGQLLMHAELDGLICSGARKGKQFSYALLEERAPEARALERGAALAELSKRYFQSHGPATVHDFAWWSGLNMADIRQGIESLRPELETEVIDGKTYWFSPLASEPAPVPGALLLPNYDEYTVGYTDRSAIFDASDKDKLGARESILAQSILVEGRVAGLWKRTLKKNEVVIELAPFGLPNKAQNQALVEATQEYGRFLELPVVLV
jgi:hypothetical protein